MQPLQTLCSLPILAPKLVNWPLKWRANIGTTKAKKIALKLLRLMGRSTGALLQVLLLQGPRK